MTHLCIDARLWHATGIGTFLKNLLRFFQKEASLELTLLCHPSQQEELKREGFSQLIPLQASLYSVKEQVEMPLKIPSCDLFWSPHFSVPVFPIRARRRLTTIHDVYHLTHRSEFSVPAQLYARFLYRHAVHHSHLVTTDSFFSYHEMHAQCGPISTPLHVIPLGVSSLFHSFYSEEKKQQLRERYQLPERFLLTIGNFKPHKNFPRLLNAFKTLSDEVHLVLIGKKEISETRVLGLPFLPEEEVPILYGMAEALVFPSLYEGFGLPPLEAMACGCPAIVSTSASLPEVCGDAVEYIDPYSVESIRRGILKVIRSSGRRQELIKKGKEHVALFTWERCAKAYLTLIHQSIS